MVSPAGSSLTSHYCKDSQITSLKLYLIVTHFDSFKHNFPQEIKTFPPKIEMDQREKLEEASAFVRIAISYP